MARAYSWLLACGSSTDNDCLKCGVWTTWESERVSSIMYLSSKLSLRNINYIESNSTRYLTFICRYEWMSEWMNWWMTGWLHEWMHEWMNGQMNKWTIFNKKYSLNIFVNNQNLLSLAMIWYACSILSIICLIILLICLQLRLSLSNEELKTGLLLIILYSGISTENLQ